MNLAGTYCEYLAESCRQVDSVISAKTQEELEPSPWEEVHLQGEILETNLAHADFAWTYYSHVAEKRLVGKDVLNTVSICLSAQERKKELKTILEINGQLGLEELSLALGEI